MLIKFLGSGSAFCTWTKDKNFQSNILFTSEVEAGIWTGDASRNTDPDVMGGGSVPTGETEIVKKHLLFDAGTTINESLEYHNVDLNKITDIVISHLHGDHVHGLEYLGFRTFFDPSIDTKPKLHSNKRLMTELWNNVLMGTMASLNGVRVGLDNYFNLNPVKPKQSFEFADTNFNLVQVPHVVDDREEIPAFGMRFQVDDTKFLITGDCQFDYWRFVGFYELYDVIFHDCEFKEYPGGVHAQFHDLCKLPDKFKKKMWLYHYTLDGKTVEELEKEVLDNGFAGLVKMGDEFDTVTLKKWMEEG